MTPIRLYPLHCTLYCCTLTPTLTKTAPTRFCATAPAPSLSESGRGTRWLLSAALRVARLRTPLLAACVAAADRRARSQTVLPQPSGSRSQTRWSLHLLLLRRRHVMVLEPFSYPARRFLHPRDRRRHHRCRRRGTRPINWHRHGGWTSDLFPSQPRPELRGEPCGHLPTPLLTV